MLSSKYSPYSVAHITDVMKNLPHVKDVVVKESPEPGKVRIILYVGYWFLVFNKLYTGWHRNLGLNLLLCTPSFVDGLGSRKSTSGFRYDMYTKEKWYTFLKWGKND